MTQKIETLAVCEIMRVTDSGETRPFQCRLADDQIYAVKGRGALAWGLLSEFYAAALGQAIGLPIPSFVVAELDADLLAAFPNKEAQSALGAGLAFASLWQEPVEYLRWLQIPSFDVKLLASIYVFDHWIKNGDRTLTEHGGNQNLLVRLTDRSLVVFDHNLAFNETYEAWELSLHACRGAWQMLEGKALFIDEMRKKMAAALMETDWVFTEAPDEWMAAEPTFPAFARDMLNRFGGALFWEELE